MPTPNTELFASIFNASPIGIAVEDLQGRPLFVNPAFCSMLGFSPEELITKHCVDFSPPEDAEKDWASFQQLQGGLINHYQLEKRYFRRDGSLLWGRLSVSLLKGHEFPLVLAMVEDISDKKKAEEDRLNQEELLKIFVANVPVGVAMVDRDMRYVQVSNRFCEDYAVEGPQILGRSHYEVFSDLPGRWKEMHQRALDGETFHAEEDRWERQSGTRWLHWELHPWKTATGTIGGILIFAEDVTQRKRLEEAIFDISRRLIQSQEQERARIGRELHDDINQRLALLAINLEQLLDAPPDLPRRVQELFQRTLDISSDVQALSHELHTSKMEHLGVVAGIKSWCREFGERQRMDVEFESHVVTPVPPEVGVTLFRILQEALHNAAKHSGVERIEVRLSENVNEVRLAIRDTGKGFDVASARQGRGLGLASMEERVRLVNGQIAIESSLMGGTSIRVRIPLSTKQVHRQAAG